MTMIKDEATLLSLMDAKARGEFVFSVTYPETITLYFDAIRDGNKVGVQVIGDRSDKTAELVSEVLPLSEAMTELPDLYMALASSTVRKLLAEATIQTVANVLSGNTRNEVEILSENIPPHSESEKENERWNEYVREILA